MPEMSEKPIQTSDDGLDSSVASAPPLITKGGLKEQAEKIRKNLELPAKPGEQVEFKYLIQWLKLLTTEDLKSRITLYVYRIHPVIIRQKANPDADNNIDIIPDGFDSLSENYFIDIHGGGTYVIHVHDSNANELKHRNPYFKGKLQIPITEHPPKLNLLEVEWENPKNKGFQSWAHAKGLIDNKNTPITQTSNGATMQTMAATNQASTDSMVQVVKTVADVFSKFSSADQDRIKRTIGGEDSLSKSIGEIMVEQMKQQDPNKMLTAMTSLMSAMKANQPVMPAPVDPMVTMMPLIQMMMQQQSDHNKMMLEMMKSREEKGSGEGEKGGIGVLKEAFEFFNELKGDGQGGAKKSTTEMLIDKGLDLALPVLSIVGNIIQLKMAQGGLPTTPVPNVPVASPMGQPNPRNMQELNEINKRLMAQPPNPFQPSQPSNVVNMPNEPMQQPVGNPMVSPQQQQLQAALVQFAPLILQNLDKDGYILPDMVANMFPHGQEIVDGLCSCGVDMLLNTLKSNPRFWHEASTRFGEEYIKQWLADFVDYKRILAELDKEEGEEEEEESKPN